MNNTRRLVLIDPDHEGREVFAQRLRAQGFVVDEAVDGVTGAEMALSAPPACVIANLWMPGVSGVQLCRLLGAEPATADVPVVLRAEHDDPHSRFWARRAGARCLVSKGRMGELVRALSDVIRNEQEETFFFQLAGVHDVRDRIAEHLDRALFESVVAAEIRALASACSFDRLFDSLSLLAAQLLSYRWLALATANNKHFGIHAHRKHATAAESEARTVLAGGASSSIVRILDDDAVDSPTADRTVLYEIRLGTELVGRLALSVPEGPSHLEAIARELGSVIRLVLLVEESQRLATTDGLTGLFNRRAFIDAMEREIARSDRCNTPCSVLVLDLDHFKAVNDTHGHASGDAVLAAVGSCLEKQGRSYDIIARWGGEEFIIALPSTAEADAKKVAERVRSTIAALEVANGAGERIPLTVSIGVALRSSGERLDSLVDRADRAMYRAKVGGRDRVCTASEVVDSPRVDAA